MSNTRKNEPNKTSASFMDGLKVYFKGVKSEWGKITWPERGQVVSETIVVIVIVFFFTVLVYFMDIIFKGVLGLIPGR